MVPQRWHSDSIDSTYNVKLVVEQRSPLMPVAVVWQREKHSYVQQRRQQCASDSCVYAQAAREHCAIRHARSHYTSILNCSIAGWCHSTLLLHNVQQHQAR
eukprot:15074-Heterococcus_DN1.PRE.2